MNGGIKTDIYHTFDRCYLINLQRRTDRLQEIQFRLDDVQWPFREVEVIRAVDGGSGLVPCPEQFTQGGGAWGCIRSHMRILEDAFMDGVNSILVMEDDCQFFPEFTQKITEFLNQVPADWDALWIGGQHMTHDGPSPETIKPGIVKCRNTQRTHCFALRRTIMPDLYRLWSKTTVHCDWVLGQVQKNYKVYSPDPFIVAQAASKSDINGANNPAKSWNRPAENAPVVWLQCPRPVLDQLRHEFHAGYDRDELGQCKGLQKVWGPDVEDSSPRSKRARLREWVNMIQWECAATEPAKICTIWHTQAEAELIHDACDGKVIHIEGNTAEEVRGKWAAIKGGW